MSSFPSAITTPQSTALRAPGYWSRVIAALNPNTIIFQAQADETLDSAPFIQFTYDNVTIGSYTDILVGMTLYISATTDLRNFKHRGRVSQPPTSSIIYLDETAITLDTGDIVTVIRDADLHAKTRRDTLADGWQTFTLPEPMIATLPGIVVLYDASAAGNVAWTPAQTGVPVASGASISSWAWAISGDGTFTYTSGSSSSQHPTIEFEAGYFYLIRCTVTDSNGVTHFQFVRLWCVSRTFTELNTFVVTGSISADQDNGYSADLTGYADLTTLLDRTEVAIFSIEHFGDNSSTPIVSNILASGRIRSDKMTTAGSDDSGQLQQVTFAVEGMTTYLQRLKMPSDIIRNVASPAEWGEITNPTTYRAACYMLTVYTTLTNLCSFTAGNSNFDAWIWGVEPVAIDGEFAADVIKNIFWDRLKALPNYAPDGSIYIDQTASFQTDRSGIVTVRTFALDDLREVSVDRDSSRVTSQVVAYGGTFNTSVNQFVLFSSQSPSIVYGDAPENKELTRELLITDSTSTAAAAEINSRAGNFYAFSNPKTLISAALYDSNGWLIPTNYQRYAFVIPASANTLGIPFTTSDYFQCQSVSLAIGTDGTIDVSAEFYAETVFADAQQISALLPNNSPAYPVLPVLPNDPAFPTDPLELYPNDDPGLDELQPIGNYSLGQTQTPFPPQIAEDMTDAQGNPGCQTMAVNFRNPNNSASPKLTTVGVDYIIKLSGFTTYGGAWEHDSTDATDLSSAWQGSLSSPTYSAGKWNGVNTTIGGVQRRACRIYADFGGTFVVNYVRFRFDLTKGSVDIPTGACIGISTDTTGAAALATQTFAATSNGTNQDFVWSGAPVACDLINVSIASSRGSFGGSCAISEVELRGTGVDPFTSTDSGDLFADAFYIYSTQDSELTAELYSTSEGLRLDNAAVNPALIPPYSASHAYQIPFDGTGNQVLARMLFADYSTKQNKNLQIEICRVN